MSFPKHIKLSLEHNPQNCLYMNVAQYVKDQEEGGLGKLPFDWVSDAERDAAIADNEIWILHWYPNTPIGFFCLAARSLDVLLAKAREIER